MAQPISSTATESHTLQGTYPAGAITPIQWVVPYQLTITGLAGVLPVTPVSALGGVVAFITGGPVGGGVGANLLAAVSEDLELQAPNVPAEYVLTPVIADRTLQAGWVVELDLTSTNADMVPNPGVFSLLVRYERG